MKNKMDLTKFCTHCSMINCIGSNSSLNYVSQCRFLPKKDEWKNLRLSINNFYEYKQLSWMEKIGLTKEVPCPFSGNKKYDHPLVFRSNSGKPISFLTNKIFSIRTISAHGDCGILCIMYAIHFSQKSCVLLRVSQSSNLCREHSKTVCDDRFDASHG